MLIEGLLGVCNPVSTRANVVVGEGDDVGASTLNSGVPSVRHALSRFEYVGEILVPFLNECFHHIASAIRRIVIYNNNLVSYAVGVLLENAPKRAAQQFAAVVCAYYYRYVYRSHFRITFFRRLASIESEFTLAGDRFS
jgi:hypothetical protein